MAGHDPSSLAPRPPRDEGRLQPAEPDNWRPAECDRSGILDLLFRTDRLVAYEWRIAAEEIVFGEDLARLLGRPTHRSGRGFSIEAWRALWHADDRTRVTLAGDSWLRGGLGVNEVEYRVEHANGGYLWVRDRARVAECDAAGQPQRVSGVLQDITERRSAEEGLRESEELYRTLAETSPDMIYLVDGEGLVRYVNSKASALFPIAPEALAGKRLSELFDSEAATRHLAAIKRVMESGSSLQSEVLDRFESGSRWLDAYLSPVRDRTGRIVAVQGVSRDITERKQAEARLADERERLAVTLRSIADGVIATDTEQRVRILNRVAETLTGWTQEEAEGRPVDEVLRVVDRENGQPCPSPVGPRLAASLAGRWLLTARDGRVSAIAASAAPIHNAASETMGAVLVLRDVTESERIEQELRQAQKLEALALLAGGIAHDFNNILTGILGNISLARELLGIGGQIAERLAEAERAATRARALTQQLLTFSKGGAPIRRARRVELLLSEAVSFTLRGSKVATDCQPDEGLWPAEVDAGQINQALVNIVLNALQAMPNGGTLRARARNAMLQDGEVLGLTAGPHVVLSISDSGPGIPETLLGRIFDPFFTTKQRGTGLGLATTYSIIRAHGGHITVDSCLSEGSTFVIYLPASPASPCEEEETPERPSAGQGRILVMDDEPAVRDLNAQILRTHGYEVECVSDGAQAVERFRQAQAAGTPFDAVILDLTVVGGMGGREALAQLRALHPTVPAVVSSGYSTDPVMADYRAYGFSAFLAKPFTVAMLLQAVRQARTVEK